MHSARQVFRARAFWLVVCAGSFCAVRTNAAQYHRVPLPMPQRRTSADELSTRERALRGVPPERAKKSPREYPKRSGEVSCTVLGWTRAPVPTLDLTCPPADALSPVRVYLRISWESTERVPTRAEDVVARSNIPTKVRIPAQDKAARAGAAVKLPTRRKGHGKEREEWFIFSQVAVDVAAD